MSTDKQKVIDRRKVFTMRTIEHLSFGEIGRRINVSRSQARAMFVKAERDVENEQRYGGPISIRIVHQLQRLQRDLLHDYPLLKRPYVKQLFEHGRFVCQPNRYATIDGNRLPYIGWGAFNSIAKWAGAKIIPAHSDKSHNRVQQAIKYLTGLGYIVDAPTTHSYTYGAHR